MEKYRDLYDLHTVFNSRIYLDKLISLTGSFDCDQNLEINLVTNPQMLPSIILQYKIMKISNKNKSVIVIELLYKIMNLFKFF